MKNTSASNSYLVDFIVLFIALFMIIPPLRNLDFKDIGLQIGVIIILFKYLMYSV